MLRPLAAQQQISRDAEDPFPHVILRRQARRNAAISTARTAGSGCYNRRSNSEPRRAQFPRKDSAMLTQVKPAFQLKDMKLFRQQCYIDGQWVDADDKSTLAVNNPGGRAADRHRPENGRRGDAARNRGRQRGMACMAREDRQGTRDDVAQMVRSHDGEPGRSRGPDDDRAGQAAGRIQGRNRLRRHRSSSGLPKKASASTATSIPSTRPTSASSSSSSRSACARRSRRGIFRMR